MNFSPILNGYQAFDDGGRPLAGGLIYTYLAGTSAPVATYFDSVGSVAHSNPIVLGSDGRPPGEIWLNPGIAYKLSLFDSLLNPIDEWDNIVGLQNLSSSNWVAVGLVPTFLNASQFSVIGNQIAIFPVGMRIQYTLTSTQFYGTITASSFGLGITTVTVLVDSTPLNSGLNLVNVSALSPVDTSVPPRFKLPVNFEQTISVAGLSNLNGATFGNVENAGATVLDWYQEQQSFTPTWTGLTTPGVTVYNSQLGFYTRIGNIIFFQIVLGVVSNTGTGVAMLGGLPYPINATYGARVLVINDTSNPLCGIGATSSSFQIRNSQTNAAFNASGAANNTFQLSGFYLI